MIVVLGVDGKHYCNAPFLSRTVARIFSFRNDTLQIAEAWSRSISAPASQSVGLNCQPWQAEVNSSHDIHDL